MSTHLERLLKEHGDDIVVAWHLAKDLDRAERRGGNVNEIKKIK